jgi:hypothetical protein
MVSRTLLCVISCFLSDCKRDLFEYFFSYRKYNWRETTKLVYRPLQKYTGVEICMNCNFTYPFISVKHLVSPASTGKTVEWGRLRRGCWQEYLGPQGNNLQKYGENSMRTHSIICSLHQTAFINMIESMGVGDIYYTRFTYERKRSWELCVKLK